MRTYLIVVTWKDGIETKYEVSHLTAADRLWAVMNRDKKVTKVVIFEVNTNKTLTDITKADAKA